MFTLGHSAGRTSDKKMKQAWEHRGARPRRLCSGGSVGLKSLLPPLFENSPDSRGYAGKIANAFHVVNQRT